MRKMRKAADVHDSAIQQKREGHVCNSHNGRLTAPKSGRHTWSLNMWGLLHFKCGLGQSQEQRRMTVTRV